MEKISGSKVIMFPGSTPKVSSTAPVQGKSEKVEKTIPQLPKEAPRFVGKACVADILGRKPSDPPPVLQVEAKLPPLETLSFEEREERSRQARLAARGHECEIRAVSFGLFAS